LQEKYFLDRKSKTLSAFLNFLVLLVNKGNKHLSYLCFPSLDENLSGHQLSTALLGETKLQIVRK